MGLNINGTTGISGVDGSASAASIAGTDANTGLSFASDTVNINTGGTTKASISSVGKLTLTSTETANSNPVVLNASGQAYFQVITPNSTIGGIKFGDTDDDDVGAIKYGHGDNSMRFDVNGSERIRLTSTGSLLIGRTTYSSFGNLLQTKSITVETDGDTTGMHFNRTDSNAAWIAMRFYAQGNLSGYIQVNTSSVTYSTSSDYRLKENVVTISDGITRLKQLKPYRFNFKENPDKTVVDGFFAHEASEVVPEAVVGTKDAVDAEGNIDPQGIDQSKLVPLLTAALQEAITKIETLETKVAALEAG